MKSCLSKYVFALLFIPAFFIFSTQVDAQSIAFKALLSTLYDADFPVLKPSQVSDLSTFQVLDTREKEEFEVSHLKNAIWVGYDTFTLKNVASLDKSKPVLVYCTVGARSQDIGKKLKEAGYNEVYNLYGGLIEWVNEGKPIFQDDFPTKKVHTYSQSWGIWLNKAEKVY
ncbi:rhodanese-like domain-containing protein [Algoriphagus sp. C2-6-M1]|uniref:rhodanese-like domain-containing protein n=1 Tax=Algoriphagus persicinus TaxID=3108754 RepID=UPI002B370A5F|nr:rhodanese-like domain-containing protein [Algoriphagus sp. C2-6-M1]MEB2779797.1 rhodanese-like domain-containing protein [Algoriphagus sp. C2-6-M1]